MESESILEIRSPSKKRKRREEEDFNNNEDDNLDDMDSTWELQSLSKRRKKKRKDVDSGTEDEEYELVSDEKKENKNTKWNRSLLQLAKDQIGPSKIYYKMDLKKLNFEMIAEELESTPEICKKQLKQLIKSTVKTKSMYQLLQETMIEYFRKSKVGQRKPTAFSHFVAKNSAKIDKVLKVEKGKKKLSVAAEMWNKLTDGEKMAYDSKVLGKPPFDIFVESKQKDESVSMKDLRTEWKNLYGEKKFECIKKSARLMMKIEERNEDENPIDRKSIKGPSREEIDHYLDYLGMPRKPPVIAQMYYFKKSGVAQNEYVKNILQEAMRRFSRLDERKKSLWRAQHKKAVEDFDEVLKLWRKEQDAVTVYVYKLHKEFVNKVKAEKTKKGLQDLKKMKPIDEYNTTEMATGRMSFRGEPTIPPLTEAQLYSSELKVKMGKGVFLRDAQKKLNQLSKQERDLMKFKVHSIKLAYISHVKSFVGSMIEEQRRLFLGFRRMKLIKLLKEDIFEKDYPNAEYPVYVTKTMKLNKAKARSTKPKRKSTKQESEDEESSETHAFQHKKIKKKCTSDSDENEMTFHKEEDESWWKENESSVGDPSEIDHTFKMNSDECNFSDEEETEPVGPNSSKIPVHSKSVNMDSDSDNENVNHKSIQAYMNSLIFKSDNVSIAKEEESESSDGD